MSRVFSNVHRVIFAARMLRLRKVAKFALNLKSTRAAGR